MVLAEACSQLGIAQRIFLPQPIDDYLSALGSDGTPDFSEEDRAAAVRFLSSKHVIQQRVVSHAADRTQRFEEVNLEILRVSDVLVCLLSEDTQGSGGGTNDLLKRAKASGKPVLEIRTLLHEGAPTFTNQWHNLGPGPCVAPTHPAELAALSYQPSEANSAAPHVGEVSLALKRFASDQARWHQSLFRSAAIVIIATHVLATVCATLAVLNPHEPPTADHPHQMPYVIALLLGAELILLATGFAVHQYLHHSHAAKSWALSRLLAEVARSVRAVGPLHVQLEHLFHLPLPHRLKPLLRTLNVLHLQATRGSSTAWDPTQVAAYVQARLMDRQSGQIAYYSNRLRRDRWYLRFCHIVFATCSLGAFLSTLCKLLVVSVAPAWLAWNDVATAALGALAIILPLLAVGSLSWAAAMDCEARVHTYEETLQFLHHQLPCLQQAESQAEFERLLLETEARLLGETLNWYYRRSFVNVA